MEGEEEAQEGFIQGNIPLVLNSYADIFSSFDDRSFSEKALSDDFLIECKRAARDKDDIGLELILSIPKAKRVFSDEYKIRRRLKEHFRKHFLEKEKEIVKIKKEGIAWIIIGALLVAAAVGFGTLIHGTLINTLMESILVIPGWFLIWEGMGKIFIISREKEPDFLFYKKMANCQIAFRGH